MIHYLGYTILPAEETHTTGLARLFNSCNKNLLPFFPIDFNALQNDLLKQGADNSFLAVVYNEQPIGFGTMLHSCKDEAFSHSAQLAYFLLPEHTGKGLGAAMLAILIQHAEKLGIWNLFAVVASNNQRSITFHQKQGFVECGRLNKVGYTNGSYFDIVFYNKNILNRE